MNDVLSRVECVKKPVVMGGEMIGEGKVCPSPGRAQERKVQWLNPSPLTPKLFRYNIFSFLLTLDPCLYLVFAKSQGDHAHGSLPGPFFQCPGFHQFPRSPLLHTLQ